MTRRRIAIVIFILLVPFALHAVWDQLEATWFAREFSQLADRHEPVSVNYQRVQLATAEQRRAARIYAAAANLAFYAREDGAPLSSVESDIDRAFASPDPASALAPLWRLYAEHEPALDLLDQAMPLDFAGFGPAGQELNENASSLQGLASLNAVRTAMFVARGDASSAARSLTAAIRLQRTFLYEFYRRQPTIDLLGSVRLLLGRAPPDAATLAALQQAFEQLPDSDSLQQQLRVHRARMLGEFWPYPPHSGAWALRVRTPRLRGASESLEFLALRPLFTRALRAELPGFDDATGVAGQPWPQKLEALRALGDRANVHPQQPLRWGLCCGAVFAPAMWGIRDLQAYLPLAGENLAIRRVIVTTLAVERYRRAHAGATPADLSALVPEYVAQVPQDPFTGAPLVYRADANGYVVYSVGRNGTNEGGRLYGFGSGADGSAVNFAEQARRDVGIRVALR